MTHEVELYIALISEYYNVKSDISMSAYFDIEFHCIWWYNS